MAESWRAVRTARSWPTPVAVRRGGPGARWWGMGLLALVALVLVPGSAGGDAGADFARAWWPPSADHPFGTDHAGRDLLARTLAGTRVSLVVGVAAAATVGLLGVVVGGVAGLAAHRRGSWVDAALMRLVDAVNALPHLVLGIVIVAMLGPSLSSVVLSVALTHWTTTARIVRAEVLALSGAGFVEAAIGAGAGRWWVLTRHLVGHVTGRVLLAMVLMVPHAIMHESALSFLGLGLPDDQASLGTIIEQSRTAVLAGHWWPAVLPGLVLVLLSIAVFVLAERLRPASWGRS